VFYASYRKHYEQEDARLLEDVERGADLPFPSTLENPGHLGWQEAVAHLVAMRDCRTPFEQLVCLTNMYRAIAKSQYPTVIGGDELADALTWVFLQAKYPTLVSDTMVLFNALDSFLEGDKQHVDGYLIHVVQGLSFQFKNVIDYLLFTQQRKGSSAATTPRGGGPSSVPIAVPEGPLDRLLKKTKEVFSSSPDGSLK